MADLKNDAAPTAHRPNRAQRRAAGQRGKRAGVAAVSMAVAMSVAAGTAMADPIENPLPGGGNPLPQTTNPAPAVPPVAPSNQGPGVIPDPPSTQWRPNPHTDNGPSTPPVYGGGTQAPTILDTVFHKPAPPMILPEPGVLRVGKYQTVKPTWMTMAELNSINRWSAYIESRIAQYWLSQGFSEEEADRRAASMVVGGLVGGAAGGALGFAIGVVPGAVVGGAIGAAGGAAAGTAAGAGIAAALGLPLNALFPVGGTGLYGSFIGVGALVGLGAGAAAGAAAGALVGGTITGLAIGIPGAAIGVGLGSLFGGGDPNQKVDQPWTYRAGTGQIIEKPTSLEFDWDGEKAIPGAGSDAHVNLQVKDDGTWVVKFGKERWIGATPEQRDKHFYAEIDKSIPGAGQAVRNLLEDEHGVFQNTVRDFLGRTAKDDPRNTQYNPKGEISDPSKREKRVPYGYSSTPDAWDKPNYADPDNPAAVSGSQGAYVPGDSAPPVTDSGTAAGPNSGRAQAVAPVEVAPSEPTAAAPIVRTGNKDVDRASADAQNALRQFIPGIPAAAAR